MTRNAPVMTENARPQPGEAMGDETGMALVMVLVAIIIIGVLFSAVLNYQSTALNAQTVLSNQRDHNFAADAAIDTAIMRMQKDTTIGSTTGSACTTLTAATLLTYKDPVSGNVTVTCKVTSASSGSSSTRLVELKATISVSTSTADVTIYDAPNGSSPSVVSITNWDRT